MKKSSIYLVVFLLLSVNIYATDIKTKSDPPQKTSAEKSRSELLSSISASIDSIDYYENSFSEINASFSNEQSLKTEKNVSVPAVKLNNEDLVDMSAGAMGVGIF